MAEYFDLTDMRLMANVAAAGSLTEAAKRTFLSLPAASTRVKNLEARLGTTLLYRNNQGVTLAPAGQAFVAHARIVMQQLEHLRDDIHGYARGMKGNLRIYANTTAMGAFIPRVLERYLISHPNVNIELRERLSYEVVKAVSEGEADIGISAQDIGVAGVRFLPYRIDRLVLVTHDDHPLTSVSSHWFRDLLGYDFVNLSEGSAIHAFLRAAAEDNGCVLRTRVEVNNFETACRLVAARAGISVIPESAARRFMQGMPLRCMLLSDAWALRKLHICIPEPGRLPAFAAEFVDLLRADAPHDRPPGTVA